MTELSMNLPTEIVERAVRDKINAAIAAQLGDPEKLIEKLVANALSQKVNRKGNVSRSSYENTHSFLDVTAGNFIREAAHEALVEFFTENREKIKDAVKHEVVNSSSNFAKVIIDGMETSMRASFLSRVKISFDSHEG